MINLISAILFSFSANLDNIAIGISYGLKKIHISLFKILMISVFTTLFTFISMFIGKYLVNILNEKYANSFGAFLLIGLGLYTLVKDILEKIRYRNNKKNNDKIEKTTENVLKPIIFKELMTIILLLSTNNIAAGIAASVTGVNILATTVLSFIFSFALLLLGNTIGKNIINEFIEKYCNILSALLLIIIGFIEL